MLEFMNLPGFFGTRAPLFMDIVSLIYPKVNQWD